MVIKENTTIGKERGQNRGSAQFAFRGAPTKGKKKEKIFKKGANRRCAGKKTSLFAPLE